MKKLVLVTSLLLFSLILVGCVDNTTSTTTLTDPITTTTTVPTDNDPVISGATDKTIEKGTTFVPLEGVTASDVEDGDLTSVIEYSGNVNPNAVGSYDAIYTVTDSDGNVATVTRKITVVFTDVQAPLITGTANETIFVGEAFVALEGVSATDTVDGTVDVTVEGTVNIWVPDDYVLTYTAEDEAGNEVTATRTITVTFGDFVFGEETTLTAVDFTAGVSTAFDGGVINDTLAPFTYLKVVISASASEAGNVGVSVGSLVANQEEIALTTTVSEHTLYFIVTESLVDATITLTPGTLTLGDLSVKYSFAEIRDMVPPTLNVPSDEAAFGVGGVITDLESYLLMGATAVDDVDGNITSSISIDYLDLDINTVGVYDIEYSAIDAGGNEATYIRSVTIGNLVDSGFISDPTFQNQGDAQWNAKSNNGEAAIAYDATEGTMNITVTKLGDWTSAAGAYLTESSLDLEANQWYVFTFTVKTTIARQMGFRMGLATDETHGWLDDFDGRSTILLDITSEYQTFNFYFKLDSTASSAGYEEFKIELNLGNVNYSNIGAGGITTFKDVQMNKIVTEFDPPTYETHQSATLPIKFTEGDTAPNWADYVTFYDMSKTVLTPTVDASAVNMAVAGTYDVIFTATDIREKSTTYTLTITVLTEANADVAGPVITIKDGVPTTVDQFTNLSVDLTQLVDAVDVVDGIITVLPEMVNNGGLNLNVAGNYTVTYTVYDLSGNITVLSVEVTVVDKQVPTISIGNANVVVGDAFDGLTGLVVTDNVDGTIDNSLVTITGLDAFTSGGIVTTEGEFEVTYTVSDALGNAASKTIIVTVQDITWDEDSRVSLGTPDEGPTHSTVTYDATEEAYVITAIDPNTDSWDHARWVYYFDANTELVEGHRYKFEITVKADQVTDLYFRIGSTLWVAPYIDNFTGGLTNFSITTDYVTYQVIFTVDKAMVNGSAKFQFMYGYLSSDATNTIYIKQFDLVEEQQPIIEDAYNLLKAPAEQNESVATYDDVNKVLTISDIQTSGNSRIVNYFEWNKNLFVLGETYRFEVTMKADSARTVEFWIGTALSESPWLDTFDGGRQTVDITDEYVTYYVYFTMDKANYLTNGAKFQFMYGQPGDDPTNKIYISKFNVQHVYYPLVEGEGFAVIDDFNYADEAAFDASTWRNRVQSNGTYTTYNPSEKMNLDTSLNAMTLLLPDTANEGYWQARLYPADSKLNTTENMKYLAFYMTNNTNKTTATVWLYWSGSTVWDSLTINLPAVGETGWAYVNVSSKVASTASLSDFAFAFNNWSVAPYTGSVTIYMVAGVENVSRINSIEVDLGDPLPPNEAPVISMTDENKAIIAGMTLKAGESIETLLPTLLSMIQINDAEDGAITATAEMLNLNGLNPTAPEMGSYDVLVNVNDSNGLAAAQYTIKLSIVTVHNDFEAYAIDTVFSDTAKGDFTDLYGIRVGQSAWNSTATVVDVSGNKMLSQEYKVAGGATNGIRLLISKSALETAGVEYIGIFMKTSAPLSSTSIFQCFQYAGSISGGFAQITSYGNVAYINGGTYVYVKVADLAADVASISLMINVATADAGTLYLDNIVLK